MNNSAALLFKGSLGFGSYNNDYILINTECIYEAGVHLFFKRSKHIQSRKSKGSYTSNSEKVSN